jgi:GNAT superfamily N-acetyltransferase
MTTSDPRTFGIRRATVAEAEQLAAGAVEGVEDYTSFAPAGWTGPSLKAELDHVRKTLSDERACCLVAISAGELVGQITVVPAGHAPRAVDDPSLAHISNLFVRRDFWGGGVARALHGAALDEARDRGFSELRLFVATGQARARRFYEREGWSSVGDPFDEPVLGLTIIEYRHTLRRTT